VPCPRGSRSTGLYLAKASAAERLILVTLAVFATGRKPSSGRDRSAFGVVTLRRPIARPQRTPTECRRDNRGFDLAPKWSPVGDLPRRTQAAAPWVTPAVPGRQPGSRTMHLPALGWARSSGQVVRSSTRSKDSRWCAHGYSPPTATCLAEGPPTAGSVTGSEVQELDRDWSPRRATFSGSNLSPETRNALHGGQGTEVETKRRPSARHPTRPAADAGAGGVPPSGGRITTVKGTLGTSAGHGPAPP